MVLNAIQKQSSNQSLHKVSLEAAVRRCSSKQVLLKILHRCFFPINIAKFLRTAFLQKTSNGCFFQIDKLNDQHWLSVDLLINVGWFLLKSFVDLFRLHYSISRNHSNTFSLINLQKTKTCSKYQTFDSLDILISAELSLVLRKFELHQENCHEGGSF